LTASFGLLKRQMGRQRTSIAGIDTKKLDQQLRRTKDARLKERLSVLKMASTGLYTLQMMAQAVGRARSVVQQWLDKFDQGGIDAMLERKKPTRRKPRIAEKICAQIDEHLRQGTWRSAGEMQRWLKQTHQIERGWGGCY
jgi:transposase